MRAAFNGIMIFFFACLLAILILTPIAILTRQPDFQVGQKWDSGGGSTMQIVARDGNNLTLDAYSCRVIIDNVCQERIHVFVEQTTKQWAAMLKAWKFTEVKE